MKTVVKKLIVKYNDRTVGYLVEFENSKIAFQYESEWIDNGFSISPLSLPLSSKVFINNKDTFSGLYGVFSDSLPDGWGELLVSRMLSKKGINYSKLPPLVKLTLISNNGLGALTYEPTQALIQSMQNCDLDELARDANLVLCDDSYSQDFDFDALYALGGSSGGARPKAHIKDGAEHWIVKFPTSTDPQDIGLQEYLANQLAKDCGIAVNEFKLFSSKNCVGYFGAKRFDIKNGKRIHMVSLSSLLETTHRIPNLDYQHLFQLIQRISVNQSDLYEGFSRMCFNVLFGNRDDHGKNFAFIYDDAKRGYRLSPAYDTTKTPRKKEHEMTVNGSGIPSDLDLLEVAKRMKLSRVECEKILSKLKEILFT
ncbi:MAG: type II toxin-antitoxin system HipA family toxin [Christensenellaceae bacterium]|jgi:serine/threonine-protein kinase HipA|nr:type II toxin-antitoxin system HipA family toxin [Christensenellaceae bacterium]